MESQRNELFVVEENNNSENEISEENNAGNADPVVQQPIVASTQTEKTEENIYKNGYSTDLYTTPKEDKESTSESSASQKEERNAGQSQSSENPSDETQVDEDVLEGITDFLIKQIDSEKNETNDLGASNLRKWLSMPLAWRKESVKTTSNMYVKSKLAVPKSDSNTDD